MYLKMTLDVCHGLGDSRAVALRPICILKYGHGAISVLGLTRSNRFILERILFSTYLILSSVSKILDHSALSHLICESLHQ